MRIFVYYAAPRGDKSADTVMSQVALGITVRPVLKPQYSYRVPTVGFVMIATTGVPAVAVSSDTVIVPVNAAFT